MTIQQTLNAAIVKLQKQKIPSAHLEAEVLLSFALNKTREYLYAHPEKKLSPRAIKRFQKLIRHRSQHYPTAYLTNHKEFVGLNFYVNKNVLIPRPDSECLVEKTLEIIKNNFPKGSPVIADIGTGSGCVAIAVAKNAPVKIYATDISSKALVVAKRNAKQHRVLAKIKFFHGDLLDPLKNKKIDILIANLPYLTRETRATGGTREKNSLRYEPALALYAANKGLALSEKFIQQIAPLKHKPKFILIEIDPRQTVAIKKTIAKYLPKTISVLKDLSGRDRVVKIEL